MSKPRILEYSSVMARTAILMWGFVMDCKCGGKIVLVCFFVAFLMLLIAFAEDLPPLFEYNAAAAKAKA